ncbi:MAG: flippase-like domain-containing protein, partial [Chloroflexi bacterium]|nr:flippase-like domain-containing protein [Chloroflexota bacterium]
MTESRVPLPGREGLGEGDICLFRFSADQVALARRLWRWLRPAIGLGLLAFLLWRVDWQEMGRIVSQASLGYVGLALLIALLTVLPRVLRWQALLLTQGTKEPFLRLLSIYLVSNFFNNFLPSDVGGDSVRMLQLAQLTGRGADAVSSVLVERLSGLFAVLLMGTVAVLSNWRLASVGGIGFLVLGAFAVFVLGMVLIFNLQGLRAWAERSTVPGLAALFNKLGKLYDSI